MLNVVVTDANGYTVVSGPQSSSGTFVAAPVAAVSTDVNGYASGVFVSFPVSVQQTDINGFNSTVFYGAPIPIVLTDATGLDPLSGAYIAAPIAVVITGGAAATNGFLLEDSSGVLVLEDGTSILLQEV